MTPEALRTMGNQLAASVRMAATLNDHRAARQGEELVQRFVQATLDRLNTLEAENAEALRRQWRCRPSFRCLRYEPGR